MFPTTGALEIIWPVKEANARAEILKSIWSIALAIFVVLLSAIFRLLYIASYT